MPNFLWLTLLLPLRGALGELLHKSVLGLEETKWAAGGGRQLLLEFLQESQAAQVSPYSKLSVPSKGREDASCVLICHPIPMGAVALRS